MIELKRALAATGLLVGIVMVSNAQAEPPPGHGADAPGHGPGKPGHPAKGPDGNKGPDAKASDAKGSVGSKGPDAQGDKLPPGAKGAPGAAPVAAVGEGRPGLRRHSELRGLRDELKAGKLKKADLETRLSKLRESNKERRDNHRAALKARWASTSPRPTLRTSSRFTSDAWPSSIACYCSRKPNARARRQKSSASGSRSSSSSRRLATKSA